MAALLNLQQNSKIESQFLQIDYLLLILSISGLSFVFICLLAIFVSRKLRNKKEIIPNNVEIEMNNLVNREHEYFILKPVMQQNNEIYNLTDECRKISSCDKMNQSFEKDISEDKDLNDVIESPDLKSPYKTAHEELFHYMYPQYPLYNVFQSPYSTPGLVKASILITEITSDDERNCETNAIKHNNSTNSNKLSNEDLSKPKQEEIEILLPKSPRVNPFNDDNKDFQDVVDEKLKLSSSNQNAEINSTEIHSSNQSFIKNCSSNNSIDSEEDSENDSTSSTSLQSTDSSNHNKKFKLKKAVPFHNLNKPSIMQTVPNRFSTIEMSSINLEKLNNELRGIDNKIRDLPPVNQLDNVDFHVHSEIQDQIASRFETLQNDITNFLDKTVSLDENETEQLLLVSENVNITSNVSPQNNRLIEIWPYNNLTSNDTPTTSNLAINSDSSIHARKSLILSSDESNLTQNININREYDLKYSVKNLKKISGSKFTKIFTIDKETPFSFKMKMEDTGSDFDQNLFNKTKRSRNRILKRNILTTFDRRIADKEDNEDESNLTSDFNSSANRKELKKNDTSISNSFTKIDLDLPFNFQMKKRSKSNDLESNSIDKINKISHLKKNKNNTINNNENVEDLTSKNRNLDDTRDDSLSSIDLNDNRHLTQQTNKNAFTDTKREMLRAHHFGSGNVKQTMKLFENVVTDAKPFEFKSPEKYKRYS